MVVSGPEQGRVWMYVTASETVVVCVGKVQCGIYLCVCGKIYGLCGGLFSGELLVGSKARL